MSAELAIVGAWPARWLISLPAGWSMLCEHRLERRRFLVTTRQREYAAARRAGRSVMHGEDWLRLVDAAEQGRACLALEQWLRPCFPPSAAPEPPDWTLPSQPLERALGPAWEGVARQQRSVRQVLAHFGARALELDPHTLATEPAGLL